MGNNRMRLASLAMVSGLLAATLAGCGGGSGGDDAAASLDAGAATGTIKIWRTQGQQAEQDSSQKTVDDFNASQKDIVAELTMIPEATYQQSLTTTKVEDLPDVFMVDGANIAETAYAEKLRPISDVVAPETISNQIASVTAAGTYNGELYAVGQFDSGLAMYGNKSMLEDAGVDYPTTIEEAWTAQEFYDAVKALAAKSGGKGIDIKEQYAGTWPGYAFTPIVNSAGFPLVRTTRRPACSTIPRSPRRSPGSQGFVSTSTRTPTTRRSRASGWACRGSATGSYNDYAKALGDDLVVIPLPDWGNGTKSGQGSSMWGISCLEHEGRCGRQVPRLPDGRCQRQGHDRRQRRSARDHDRHGDERALQARWRAGAVRQPAREDVWQR